MSHFLFEMWLNINTRKQHQTEGNKMQSFKSVMKIYYFTVRHPETNELKIVRHPAANEKLAYELLVMKCGKKILDRIVSVKVSA